MFQKTTGETNVLATWTAGRAGLLAESEWAQRVAGGVVQESIWHGMAERSAQAAATWAAVAASSAANSVPTVAITAVGSSSVATTTLAVPVAAALAANVIKGTENNDTLYGTAGSDVITGGKGDDLLFGSGGSDVYVFAKGDGQDRISEVMLNTEKNSIRLTNVRSDEGLRLEQNSLGDLFLFYGTGDRIEIRNTQENMQVQFADGVRKTLSQLMQQHGVDSLGQIDTFFGSTGDDVYYIDHLNDRIVLDAGGNDTAVVSVSGYMVPEGIENVVYVNRAQPLPYFIKALASDMSWGNFGEAAKLTYSFVSQNTESLTGFQPYTLSQKAAVRKALAAWAEVADITFTETADSSSVDMRFFRYDFSYSEYEWAAAYAYFPTYGDVYVNTHYTIGTTSGDAYDHVLVHENGHALGLKHPGQYDESDWGPYLPAKEDKVHYTRMSYNQEWQQTFSYAGKGPQIFDVAAIHYLYGVNKKQRTGDNTYRIGDTYIWDGAGNDTLDARDQQAAVNINLAPGSWIYSGSKQSSILSAGQAFIGYGTELENVHGTAFDDRIWGNGQANKLFGHNGNDALYGMEGDDRLYGGAGADRMNGGAGNDQYWVDSRLDVVIERTGGGTDTVYAAVSHNLANQVENLTLTGSNHLNGTGNALDNLILGNVGNNILNGGAGNDRLSGGAGNDRLVGGLGQDRMTGGAGNDVYIVDHLRDSVVEVANQGTDTVYSNLSYTLGGHVENLNLSGSNHINGIGNALNNVMFGNAGNNVLNGGGGNDRLSGGGGHDKLLGGLGNDTLAGGAGNDVFVFHTALGSGNVDRITDFGTGGDKIGLSKVIFGNINTSNSAFFHQGSTAADANDRINYEKSSGKLYYDADGNGGGAAVQFAQLNPNTQLEHTQFQIV